MKAALAWVTSLGRKPATTAEDADAFALRLQRLGKREAARDAAAGIFRHRPEAGVA